MEHNIDTGDILLVGRKKTLLAKLIMWFTQSVWHHAGIFVVIDDLVYVSEAEATGIVLTKWEHYLRRDVSLMVGKPVISANKFEKAYFKSVTLQKLGRTRYDFENTLFLQPVRWISKRFGKEIWLGKKEDDNYNCGEWVAMLWNERRGLYPNDYKIAPKELIINDFDFEEIK